MLTSARTRSGPEDSDVKRTFLSVVFDVSDVFDVTDVSGVVLASFRT